MSWNELSKHTYFEWDGMSCVEKIGLVSEHCLSQLLHVSECQYKGEPNVCTLLSPNVIYVIVQEENYLLYHKDIISIGIAVSFANIHMWAINYILFASFLLSICWFQFVND
jgi:hypothetical protein